jgi:hypothetical protein
MSCAILFQVARNGVAGEDNHDDINTHAKEIKLLNQDCTTLLLSVVAVLDKIGRHQQCRDVDWITKGMSSVTPNRKRLHS